MTAATAYDAVIVGSGPNGLAAAIALQSSGLSTLLVEGADTAGGGMRSSALTLPGFMHDVCSAIHPLGRASPFFKTLGLERFGLQWIESTSSVAHVLSSNHVVTLERSLDQTVAALGGDGQRYRDLMTPFVESFEKLLPLILAPLRFPEHPFLMARFGLEAVQSMTTLARRFDGHEAPALLAGIAAHAMIPLEEPVTASFALVLALAAHAVGWPVAKGGSQSLADALVAHYEAIGGKLQLGRPVNHVSELPHAHAIVLDVSPKNVLRLAGDRLTRSYVDRLRRFRYGPGVYKVDWALDGPIPWTDPRCTGALTVHLAGPLSELASRIAETHEGRFAKRPFIIVGQPSLVDETRAPKGKQTAWAYCHVPHGSSVDARIAIESEIERYAPGFRDIVLARSSRNAIEMEAHNPNYVGGDINSGVSDWKQLFFRPMAKVDPYATSAENIFLCSSSTPPGGGVHGMCGYWAAQSVLKRRFGQARSR